MVNKSYRGKKADIYKTKYTGQKWDQLEDEKLEEYDAFQTYLTMGPGRSVYDMNSFLAYDDQASMIKLSTLKKWASRAIAYDAYMRDIANAAADKELDFIRLKQKKIAVAMQSLAMRKIKDMMNADTEELSTRDAIALIEKSVKIESAACEIPTEVIKNETDVKISVEHVDPELLAKLGREMVKEES